MPQFYTAFLYRNFIPHFYTAILYRNFIPQFYTAFLYRNFIPHFYTALLYHNFIPHFLYRIFEWIKGPGLGYFKLFIKSDTNLTNMSLTDVPGSSGSDSQHPFLFKKKKLSHFRNLAEKENVETATKEGFDENDKGDKRPPFDKVNIKRAKRTKKKRKKSKKSIKRAKKSIKRAKRALRAHKKRKKSKKSKKEH